MVVDDDSALRHLLVEALNMSGYMATGVSSAEEALEQVVIWGAQVVLLDICMPKMNGTELARILKERDPGTQIILMTGFPSQDSIDEAYNIGVDGYLLKPFKSLNTVTEAIERAAHNIRTWQLTVKDSLRKSFPEEYRIIYDSPELPYKPTELEKLIKEVSEDM